MKTPLLHFQRMGANDSPYLIYRLFNSRLPVINFEQLGLFIVWRMNLVYSDILKGRESL